MHKCNARRFKQFRMAGVHGGMNGGEKGATFGYNGMRPGSAGGVG